MQTFDHLSPNSADSDEAAQPRSCLTLRAFVLGTLAALGVTIMVCMSEYIIHSFRMGFGHVTFGTMLFFYLVVTIGNFVLKLINRRWALRPEELLVVFIMTMLAGSLQATGMTSYLVATLATPYYFASPENHWAEIIHPYLPAWLLPSNENNAMRWFFDGKPVTETVPWEAWIPSLIWWLGLLAAVLAVCLSVVVVMRKQWVEHERLVFPLAAVPIEMVRDSDNDRLLPAFMSGRLFWLGFAIPAFIVGWNIIGYFYPAFPQIVLRVTDRLHIARAFPAIRMRVNLFLVGFAFLANTSVLFSIWFFHVLGTIEIGIFNRIGFSVGTPDIYTETTAAVGWQSFGGLTFLVIFMLWRARRHLWQVVKRAFGAPSEINDDDEMLSYRQALVLLVIGLAFIIVIMRRAGMTFDVIALFLLGSGVMYVGLTRIVAESGLVYLRTSMAAQSFAMHTIGTMNISPFSMAAIAVSYSFVCDGKAFVMPGTAHIGKLSGSMRGSPRALAGVIFFATLLSAAVSVAFTIWLAYQYGANNFHQWQFRSGNIHFYSQIVSKMLSPAPPNWGKLGFFAGGGVVVALLSFLISRFPWWPIHPIGFCVSNVWPVRIGAFSVFVAWAIKVCVIKLGGIEAYRRAQPFFMGVIAGFVTGVAVSFAVDLIWFPGQGHSFWY